MNNVFKTFHNEVSWNTKFYVLLAFCMVLFSYFMNDAELGLMVGAVVSLFIVLFVDLYLILSKRYSKSWKVIKYILLLIIIALLLIGFTSK